MNSETSALEKSVLGKESYIEIFSHGMTLKITEDGSVEKDDIYRKLYDSLIMLMECGIIPDFDFIRKNIRYILVYNGKNMEKFRNPRLVIKIIGIL